MDSLQGVNSIAVRINPRVLGIKVNLPRLNLDPNQVRKGIKVKAEARVKAIMMLRKGLERHHQEPGINLPHELLTEKRRMIMSMKKKTRNKILIRKKRRMVMTRMKRNGGIKSQKQNRLRLRNQ